MNALRVVVVSGVVLSLYGVLQYLGVDPLIAVHAYSAGEGPFQIVRPPGTFGHADYFATWLVFVVFSAVTVGRMHDRRWTRIPAFVTVALAAFATVLTGTRAAVIGLVAGAVVLIAFRAVPLKPLAISLASGVLILSVFIVSPLGTRARARIHWSGDDTHGGARLLIWRDSLRMASHHLITGTGPETFSLKFPQYESAGLARAYPDFYHESPHNVLLDELTSKGVPGLLLFLATMIAAGGRALRRSSDPRGNTLSVGLLATFVALFVCQQFSVFVVGTGFAFYLCAAMLIASTTTPLEILSTGSARLPWFAMPAITLSACFAIYAARLTVGDYQLARAGAFINAQNPWEATRRHALATRWLPPGSTEDLYFSRTMAALSLKSPVLAIQAFAWREALNLAVHAVAASEDRQNAWYSLASLLARQNDIAGVERSLRNAIAWAPNWFKPHWKLAEVLALSGRHSEALMEAKTASDLDGGKDAEVNATLKALSEPTIAPH